MCMLSQIKAGELPSSLRNLFIKWLLKHFFQGEFGSQSPSCWPWAMCPHSTGYLMVLSWGMVRFYTLTANANILWEVQIHLALETLQWLSVSFPKMGSVIITGEYFLIMELLQFLIKYFEFTLHSNKQNSRNVFFHKFHFHLLTICLHISWMWCT